MNKNMSSQRTEGFSSSQEERPLFELPALLVVVLIFISLLEVFFILFLPLEITVGVLVGIMSIVLIFFKPFYGLIVFVALNYLQPARFFLALRPLHITRVISVITLLAWLFHLAIGKNVRFVREKKNLYIFCFSFAVVASSFWHFDYSFIFLVEAVKVIILYFLIANLVINKRMLHFFVWALVLAGTAVALIGIYQHFQGIGLYYADEGILRVTGPLDDPNDFALHLIITIPFIAYLFLRHGRLPIKCLLMGMFFLIFFAAIFTYSRGGAIGLLVIMILLAQRVIALKKYSHVKIWINLIFFVLFVILLVPLIPGQYWQRVEHENLFEDPAVRSRLDVWQTGLEMIKDKPLTGIGLGTFQYFYHPYAPVGIESKRRIVAHNMYISVGAENGIPALLFFLAILARSMAQMRWIKKNYYRRKNPELAHLAEFTAISLAGYYACSMFLSVEWLQALWILIGLSSATYAVAREELISAPEGTHDA